MSVLDWLLLAAVAAGVFLALRRLRRVGGGCRGDCRRCQAKQCGRLSEQDPPPAPPRRSLEKDALSPER